MATSLTEMLMCLALVGIGWGAVITGTGTARAVVEKKGRAIYAPVFQAVKDLDAPQ